MVQWASSYSTLEAWPMKKQVVLAVLCGYSVAALDGHMRAHYTKQPADPVKSMRAHYTKKPTDPVESIDEPEVLMAELVLLLTGPDESQLQQGKGVDQGIGRAVLPFDLNKLPIKVYLEDGQGRV